MGSAWLTSGIEVVRGGWGEVRDLWATAAGERSGVRSGSVTLVGGSYPPESIQGGARRRRRGGCERRGRRGSGRRGCARGASRGRSAARVWFCVEALTRSSLAAEPDELAGPPQMARDAWTAAYGCRTGLTRRRPHAARASGSVVRVAHGADPAAYGWRTELSRRRTGAARSSPGAVRVLRCQAGSGAGAAGASPAGVPAGMEGYRSRSCSKGSSSASSLARSSLSAVCSIAQAISS
jgi:hypothetical protein